MGLTEMPAVPTINPDLADILASLLKRPELNDWSWWDMTAPESLREKRVSKYCGSCQQYWKLSNQVVRSVKKTEDECGLLVSDHVFVLALDDKCKKVYWYVRPNR